MNGRFFLDTNIFVYSFDKIAPAKARKAAQLIRQAGATRKEIISYQVVQEFFNVAFRWFAQPMSPGEAGQYLSVVFLPLLAIQSSQGLNGEALRLYSKYELSWYDSLMVAAALEGQCGTLYSEDLQHGQQFDHLRVETHFF